MGSARFLASLGRPGMYGCERVTRFTRRDAMGRPGFWPASVARDLRVRTGDTVYKAWYHGSAKFLASLGRPGMYGVTGHHY